MKSGSPQPKHAEPPLLSAATRHRERSLPVLFRKSPDAGRKPSASGSVQPQLQTQSFVTVREQSGPVKIRKETSSASGSNRCFSSHMLRQKKATSTLPSSNGSAGSPSVISSVGLHSPRFHGQKTTGAQILSSTGRACREICRARTSKETPRRALQAQAQRTCRCNRMREQ